MWFDVRDLSPLRGFAVGGSSDLGRQPRVILKVIADAFSEG